MSKIIWIDCETTDSDIKRGGGIHQLSYILDIDGKEVVKRNFKMSPFKNDLINAKALQVCNVTIEEIQAYPSPIEAFNILVQDIKPYKKVIIGSFNGAIFDNPYFQGWWFKCRNESKRWDLDILEYIHFDPLDVRILALNDLQEIRDTLFGFKLSDVAGYYGVASEADKLHDASYDIQITRDIYYAIKAGKCPIKNQPLQSAIIDLDKKSKSYAKDDVIDWVKTLPSEIKSDNIFRAEFARRYQ